MEIIREIIGLFQSSYDKIDEGRTAVHKNYDIVESKDINYKPKIARNVIRQSILSKDDFIKFIKEYANEQTKIFYNKNTIKAIFNYPTAEKTDYEDSICMLTLQTTEYFSEFAKSLEIDLSQKNFIRLLKRLEPYIVAFDDKNVDDMDIIETAENLQAVKSINSINRNTEQKFSLDVSVGAGVKNLTIPRYITFKFPVYKNDLEIQSVFKTELFMDSTESGFMVNLVCYGFEEEIEGAARKITDDITSKCEGIKSYMV